MTTPGPVLITHRIAVRFSDCDPLGHVNNARYLTYLEQARIELWRRQAGLELSARSAGSSDPGANERFILARMEIDFLAPAHDGDVLEIKLTLDKPSWKVDWTLVDGNIKSNEGSWKLEPYGEGETYADYRAFVSVGFSVPSFIGNKITQGSLPSGTRRPRSSP